MSKQCILVYPGGGLHTQEQSITVYYRRKRSQCPSSVNWYIKGRFVTQ